MLGITTIRTVSSSGDPDVDAMLIGKRWSSIDFFSQAVELWYAFPSRHVSFTDYGSDQDAGELESFRAITAAQQAVVRTAFNLISSYTLLSFKQDPFYIPNQTANDTTHSELLFGQTDATDAAHAYATDTPDDKSGDVWFNRSSGIYDAPVRGDYAFITFLHEIGHAIGLKHPHEAETFGAMSLAHDSMNYTVMSYRSYEGMDVDLGFGNEEFGYAQTYMMYDIAALQHMYGANFSENSWDNVYRWNPGTGAVTNNGAAWITPGANRVFMTVWDGGGIDTYDLSAYTNAVSIDLNPGAWTQTSAIQRANLGDGHYAIGNIANALLYKGDTRSLIENAKGGSGEDRLLGNQAANLLTGNGGNDTLEGRLGNDTLDGGAGHDILDGGEGADLMRGGAGNDQYQVDDEADTIVELAAGGIDTVGSTADAYTLPANVEELVGLSTTSGQRLTGNALANTISARNAMGGNVLDGGAGADRLIGTFFDDTFHVDNVGDVITDDAGVDTIVSRISWTLTEFFEKLTLDGIADINGAGSWIADVIIGNGAANRLEGNGGNDRLDGGAGNDVLDGGTGIDDLTGGFGDDLFIIDSLDVVLEEGGQGTDTIEAGFSYALGENFEKLVLTGAAVEAIGNILHNTLVGNDQDNRLDGGIGWDTMIGGNGNDTYFVDSVNDNAVESSAVGGIDTVNSAVSFVLNAFVEKLNLTGGDAINGTGNELANVLNGNSAANVLNGKAGADTMSGGAGNDAYFVDNALDKAIESAGGGVDKVTSSVTFTLAGEIENLVLSGSAAINGTGNGLANLLTGNGGANLLDGKAGADTMQGGGGNDIYIVDNAGDQAIEVSASHGIDQVNASVSFTLAAKLENLTLTGSAAINGTGNAAANLIIGNAAANLMNGMAGADELRGGAGNDTYIVDNLLDVVVEASSAGGTDQVNASASFTLGGNVENLTLTGTGAINGTGNGLANSLLGNSGANILDGKAGADTMQGGAGNDTYIVDNALDQAIEVSASHGIDLVQSSVSYTLAAKLENLTLTGTSAINGTGNAAANGLTGNAAKNSLDGGAGSDTLFGGDGADRFVFANGPGATNVDTILDFVHGTDRIVLDNAVFTALADGALAAGAFRLGSGALDADDRILYDAATGNLYYDRDGIGAAAAIQFATLDNLPAIVSAGDFLVI